MATRKGSAEWQGDLQGGSGTLELGSGAFSGSYSAKSRFEEGEGTNPEELIGAAQAACFSMLLSHLLSEDGHVPDSVRTTAAVQLRSPETGPPIRRIDMRVEGRVPGIDDATFKDYAERAKADCTVTIALAGVPEIEVDAELTT
ncbi:MAG TPA: OsmC family peroxiredoxin [Thermoleophilaceae bacterium]|nr:OsmC family peroxiredoxin [Thermoleophilaceae bacterium]